ncbi:hypothetical protein J3459_007814 [Metarhizium acridum]|uniref:uncharacterized protein n=1 Tax=Metarhizium acridum TaxID=92637 RepID=UPI001C6C1C29|nr:hypothetical protein J3458_006973 [Metarhizium acridum]KAG8426766.1 hypothetical protein J3459_007814 [Metarhizium acridum]
MSTTQPIRVGLIGLSASAVTKWASAAHLPNFQNPAGRSRYRVTALCNSSVSAAEAAIQTYKLGPDTKAYGNPEDLAADPDVDFVICNTRVDKHLETVLPSIKAGKDVYIEWPIASNTKEIRQLVDAGKASGTKVLVGLQGRWAAPVLKIKEILDGNSIGKVLSSEVRAYGGTKDREILPVGLKYFADGGVGGNPITIGFGHVIDFVQSVVGDFIPDSVNAHFQLQRPEIRVRDPSSNEIIDAIRSNVPDFLSLHGTLPASTRVKESATLDFLFRRGQPFPSVPSLSWTLNCELGEIRLVSPSGISLQADAYHDPVTIQIHRYDTDRVEDVAWDWDDVQKEVPERARTVQKVLYAFADSRGAASGSNGCAWVEIGDAALRAAQLQSWLDGFEP